MSDQDRISPHNILTISDIIDENIEKDNLGDYLLIQYQILQSNIIRIVWQTVERVTDEISGVKGLNVSLTFGSSSLAFPTPGISFVILRFFSSHL